ncbi:hypothetical protein K505DRAFT_230068 [Melanomma pulvis-pyrius CBS 109.77]|uniref:AAA+ ATPase domain-containing protein n=1 Tax=Melanomma pulvis-pyrius CBS 109.77 TaxID=1314802 RepID=A0A6A6XW86_9PLEO|nr:hypothetical protein K505DRAFT_230068 [Melanomma pulvis-pyrius CBS 109.77]
MTKDDRTRSSPSTKKKKKSEKKGKRSSKKKKKKKVKGESSSNSKSSSEDSETSESEDDSSESSSSEDEKEARRKKKKAAAKKKVEAKRREKAKAKAKEKAKKKQKDKKKKNRKQDSSSESSSDSSSSSDSESEDEDEKEKRKKKKDKARAQTKKTKEQDSFSEDSSSSSSSSASSDSEPESEEGMKKKSRNGRKKSKGKGKKRMDSSSSSLEGDEEIKNGSTEAGAESAALHNDEVELDSKMQKMSDELAVLKLQQQQKQAGILAVATKTEDHTKKNMHKGALEFKRVDQIWDSKTLSFKYTETGKEDKDDFDCVFSVRRKFSWDNKLQYTALDVKSHLLRDVLKDILKGVRGVSLVEDIPEVHPHMIFLYHNELKAYIKKLKSQLKRAKKSKDKKRLEQQRSHCKLLARFVDEDYGEMKKKLKPMLKAGNITYEMLWALYKPNTIAYTPTYGNKDDPRCFKVDLTYLEEDFLGNEKMVIEGRYLEYDGKIFGMGEHAVSIPAFKGPKKVINLEAYPLKFHKDPEDLRKQLIERGQKFVALQGMNYRTHKGLAYSKQKRSVVKVTVNGRVMVDPAIFRRINPNYPLSYIKQDEVAQNDSDSDSDSDDASGSEADSESSEDSKPKRIVVWKDKRGKKHLIPIPINGNLDTPTEKLEALDKEDGIQHVFTEEELLIASPVVLGFSFSEKFWLEFSLQSISEIEWNKEAFESLVLAKHYKQNLKGLVSSHRFNAAKTIDDVIQGKGKGMVVVLHGPPGVGKTLTAESIAEYLRCPLYAVSAGELGTNSRSLETDLNRIMDITHSWGAILLIDEADVFMEARQAHDIHRNSLVSVFLRLLEYYQGILFLTTNRVATFDEAFQSRIHMGIKYDNLTSKARQEIWKHHINKVVHMEGQESVPFKDSDIEELSHKVLNGRQIKNNVKTAQSIALSEKEVFSIKHIKRVMKVQDDFEQDMRGGGRDAMRQYV